ncbi:MAG: DNA mismatch repair protein MutS [Lachnospiraceae bacterium]|nr:DNA mismatch repair protein MutS [Eubacterium sp.]MCI6795566.1 DNA mismatch repair protein MutS [Lachnospiraceae bacterium]MDD7049146.1 DNA mismatch repair protein MutS [Lachnospiraceae bacterium]
MPVSPMMQHYLATKEEYKDCILFYRLGDFYEMFFDDAKTVSEELELTLTGKDCGMEERAPMCGIPYHAADTYITRLIEKGHKVAICEQMEDPKQAKGIVKREVIRVVTPGTIISQEELDETRNNYLMCIVDLSDRYGLSVADISTGQCLVSETDGVPRLMDEIQKFRPSEIICNQALLVSGLDMDDIRGRQHIAVSALDDYYFDDEACSRILTKHFHTSSLAGLGVADFSCGVIAAGALFQYLYETQKNNMDQMTALTPYFSDRYMLIDSSSRRNLELVETLREKQKKGSLLGVLDRTKTAMGARMLRSMIEQPLIQPTAIEDRLTAVEELTEAPMNRDEIREYLQPVYDLERLASRITYQSANPRDLMAFKTSLQMLPFIRQLLSDFQGTLLKNIREDMDPLEDLYQLVEDSIQEDPPLAMKEGGIIRDGYNEMVDQYRAARKNGKQWLSDLEQEEREKTGIRTLRVKYNKVFGYCIEVTNSFKDQVPDYYTRRQTLAGAERYTTDRLKEIEQSILGAEEHLYGLEYQLFSEVRDKIAENVARIQKTAQAVAALDVFCSLSYVAEHNRYVRPRLNSKGRIDIKEGRHPVVEQMMKNDMFISNNTYLDQKDKRVAIITGPNMAGKSTYMRQTALIVLMAQIGSFVPAESADIGIVDRIFTRVGASDDLASGQSTFMVEMTEVANILRNATSNSLLILDEIGRGTSTFDGLAIAWAVIEYVSDPKKLGAKTLFATHYHELTELEGKLPGVNNYCIAVKEKGDGIVFLRKIVRGGADKSYGIQVARLAGVPEPVLQRADELVKQLSDADITAAVKNLTDKKVRKEKKKLYDTVDMQQMSLFDANDNEKIINELKELDISSMTPLQALNMLNHLQSEVRNRW